MVAWDALNLQNSVPFRFHTYYTGCATVEDAANNAINAANVSFTTADVSAPTMTITSAEVSDGASSNDSTLAMTFTSSASTSNFVVGDITVSGGALSSFSGSGTTYTATFTPSAQGATTIGVATGVFTDSGGGYTLSTGFNLVDDSTAPTTTFSPANSATAVAVASDITLTFNEAVRLINNSALDDSNVDALITLKENNSSGADIAFNATINGGKTVITINPDSNLSSTQVVYVAIGATVEDASNNAINAANVSFTTADIVAPTTTFSPANSATAVAVASDITLTFNEAVRLINNSALDDSNVDALITLKENNSSGADIAFNATINGGKTVITINPNSNLSSTQVVYVAIGATVEDASNNAINAANVSFTTADIVAPTTTFSPANSATAVAVASDITLTFNEAVRLINNSALDDSNVDALITLKENNSSGADIAFNATINGGKTVITINPDSNLSSTQVVYVAIGATVEDASNNAINAANVSFTTADVVAPTTTFSPANSATAVAVASDITLTFNEAVRLINNSALDDSNVDALITLKENNSSGADIAFNATINGGKTVITINPDSNLSSTQVVYVAIGATVEDAANNAINAANVSFTTADVSAPTMTITSAEVSDGASSNDSTLAMTFTSSEATSNFVVGDISVNGGALSSFNGTSTTVYTATFTPSGDGAKTIDVAGGAFTDSSSNNNSAATQFNWTYDATSPTTTFSPANSATAVAVASDITLTFNEAVRLINNSALDDSNVDALITLKEDNASGADIAFDATINGGKTVITINPNSNLSSTQVVYVAIGATVEDASNNAINAA